MPYETPFYTGSLILPTTLRALSARPPELVAEGEPNGIPIRVYPRPIAPPMPADAPSWAAAPAEVTLSLVSALPGVGTDGALPADLDGLPDDARAAVYKVNTAGGLTLMAELTKARPVIALHAPGAYVVDKAPSSTPVGVDVDGFYSVNHEAG